MEKFILDLIFSGDELNIREWNPAIKIVLSVGGWGADGFSEMAADDEKRATFVSALVDLLREKKLDGIDIDWEYPSNGGAGISESAAETQIDPELD